MFDNIKFYIYTKLLNFFLKRQNFYQVEIWLNKKKELAKKLREKLK